MEIKLVTSDKKEFLELLLLADEQESMIDRVFSAKYTRMHNDANALCMGGRVVGPGLAVELVDAFLAAGFEGGRHARRVEKLAAIEARERGGHTAG